MEYIVFDLEWNQPKVMKKRMLDLIGEIIQIGAAKIDLKGEVIDTFSVTIKPAFYKTMNKEIQELTLITDEDLENGLPFEEAVKGFREWCGPEFSLVSWGPSDLDVLINNLEKYNMETDWLGATFDAQLMFDDYEMQEGRQFPLNYALYHYNEKPAGMHNALSDVMSTVAVLKHFNLEEAFKDEYFRCD